uniref:Putative secreted protein n=2 Tax=Anopheles marajoara TaxID=58244 RepID=A0A2M4C2X3_9DIPT
MAYRMVVCVPVATTLLLSLTLAAPTVHLGPPLEDSQTPTGPQGNGIQTTPDRNNAADRPYIEEPAWFTVTTSPIAGASDASGQLTGRVDRMPVLPAQPATMRPYVAYFPVAPVHHRPHLPPGWPTYLPGVPSAFPILPPNNHFCNQPSPATGYQLM